MKRKESILETGNLEWRKKEIYDPSFPWSLSTVQMSHETKT
uniref:Uncharacterized protein n=1 Tax=uncultured marine crenarchaeote E48-1C TaxID=907718 RepID=G9BAT3_9ARCH|nr:hypothetical protein E48-1C_13 [uncultured marine crenarchaeote E48-1C]